jgi:hypothetical protein
MDREMSPREQEFAQTVKAAREVGLVDKTDEKPAPAPVEPKPEAKVEAPAKVDEPAKADAPAQTELPLPEPAKETEPFEGFKDLPENVQKHYLAAQEKIQAEAQRAAAAEQEKARFHNMVAPMQRQNNDLIRQLREKDAAVLEMRKMQTAAPSAEQWEKFKTEFPEEAKAIEDRLGPMAKTVEALTQQLEQEKQERVELRNRIVANEEIARLGRPEKEGGFGFPNFREVLASDDFKAWFDGHDADDQQEIHEYLERLDAKSYAKVLRRFRTDKIAAEQFLAQPTNQPVSKPTTVAAAKKPEADPSPVRTQVIAPAKPAYKTEAEKKYAEAIQSARSQGYPV